MRRSGSIKITDLMNYAKKQNLRDCFFRRGGGVGGDGGAFDQGGEFTKGVGKLGDYWAVGGGIKRALIYASPTFDINLSYQSHDRPIIGDVVRIVLRIPRNRIMSDGPPVGS